MLHNSPLNDNTFPGPCLIVCNDFAKQNKSIWFELQGEVMGKEHLFYNCCWLWIMTAWTCFWCVWHRACWFACMYIYNWLCGSSRSTALWPLSRFLAITQHSPFPFLPWERLPLSLFWQGQWPDCSVCDVPVWPVPPYRCVNSHEAARLVSHLLKTKNIYMNTLTLWEDISAFNTYIRDSKCTLICHIFTQWCFEISFLCKQLWKDVKENKLYSLSSVKQHFM